MRDEIVWPMFSRFAGLVVPAGIAVVCSLFLLAGCSQRPAPDPYELVLGTWKTERGIVMSVEKTSEGAARASVKLAPGFGGEDVRIGRVIISHIKPEPSGGYSGIFVMPGKLKAIRVEISVLHRNTMLIISRDKRVKGNRMIWKRVKEERIRRD